MSEPVEERHSDEEYLDAVREHEPAATSEIAEVVGVARQSADYRLRKLEDERKVTSKTIGNSLAWSLADGIGELRGVDPDDGFWDAETYAGEAMSASDIDDVVYGDVGSE
jgi:DNA-binding transcriptional ArsR family regulator